jgi:hypothetical protein
MYINTSYSEALKILQFFHEFLEIFIKLFKKY